MDVETARQRSRMYGELARGFSAAERGLEAEFTRLFLGPGRPVAHPYESVYREGRTMGDTTLDVRRRLVAEGLAPEGRTLPDHVGIELAFMAHLTAREALAWEGNDAEGALAALRRQGSFLDDHLTAWLPQFCSRVLVGRPHPHYADLAHRAEDFVAEDAARVRSWLGDGKAREQESGERWVVTVGAGCTFCEICTQVCRPGALRVVRDAEQGTIGLYFNAARCDGCAACQRWCPEDLIRLHPPTSNPQPVSRDLQLATSNLLPCPRCGRLHAPAAMVDKVLAQVGVANKALLDRMTLCQACKITNLPAPNLPTTYPQRRSA